MCSASRCRLDDVGPDVVQSRTIERMDPDLLDMYGGGNAWYLGVAYYMGSNCSNGNYLETDDMAVGHGVCGDTPQVIVLVAVSREYNCSVYTNFQQRPC